MKFTDFEQIKSAAEYQSMSSTMRNCLASLALSDMLPDKETLDELLLLDSGRLTHDEFMERTLKKAGVKQ